MLPTRPGPGCTLRMPLTGLMHIPTPELWPSKVDIPYSILPIYTKEHKRKQEIKTMFGCSF